MRKTTSLFTAPGGGNYVKPFALVATLFLLWGFAHGLLDVLDKHFQDTLHISKAQSGFVQFAMYSGYLFMAYPAGLFMKKYGYKKGIILGLGLFAAGAFLFYPISEIKAFIPFLIVLFIIACGLTCLETAANPYTTVMGPPEGAARRINIAQSFNGLGWILGPLVGGFFVFGGGELVTPYMILGSFVVVVAIVFSVTSLPAIVEDNQEHISATAPTKELWKHPAFIAAVVAQFFYVAAQTGFNSFFINYVTETIHDLQPTVYGIMKSVGFRGRFLPVNPEMAAASILGFGGMGAFWLGRLSGSWLMKFVRPERLLGIYAVINTILSLLVVLELGWLSVIALFSTYFFMSLMFPTIFALGIRGLGPLTKKASSFLVMAIVGGALCPPAMGLIADTAGNMAIAFVVPLVCFAFIAWYARFGTRLKSKGTVYKDDGKAPLITH